jgi:hypothetical protein
VPKGKKQKAADHKQHMKLQREKELKRKERRNTRANIHQRLKITSARFCESALVEFDFINPLNAMLHYES